MPLSSRLCRPDLTESAEPTRAQTPLASHFPSCPEPDSTDPLIFLCVLLVADPAEEEMFCLILKCEENCCEPAKSHQSTASLCFSCHENQGERKCLCCPRHSSDGEIPIALILIKVNWQQLAVKYFRMFGYTELCPLHFV